MLNVGTVGIMGEIKEIELENLCNNAIVVYIYATDGVYKALYSYNTLICILKNGGIYRISKKWNFSRTTGKHRNLFLNQTGKELEKFIKEKMTYCSDIEQYVLKGDE